MVRAFHLPTRGPRVESRGCFAISWVGSRLPRRKRRKRVRAWTEGRVLGSGARIEFLIRAKTPFAFAFVRQRGAAVAAGQRNELWGNVLHFVGLYRPLTPSRRCEFQFGVWYSSGCSAIVVFIGLCGSSPQPFRATHIGVAPHDMAEHCIGTVLAPQLGPFWPAPRSRSPCHFCHLQSAPAEESTIARQWA